VTGGCVQRKSKSREVNLRLASRGRLKADYRLRNEHRADLATKGLQLRVASGIASGSDLLEEAYRRQLGIGGESAVRRPSDVSGQIGESVR
jgi:hypothetical protein